MARMPQSFISSTKDISKRLVAAYVFDWIAIIGIAAIAAGIANITPHYRAFSVIDLTISFPLVDQTVPAVAIAFIAGVTPAIIVCLVALLAVPGPATYRTMSRTTIIQWKLWELNAGLLSLALTHATSQVITQGMKNVAGKPRPDMLARCMPDMATLANHRVGGYGQDISPGWIMVNQEVCTQTNKSVLNDGFRSFPSGHATTVWAGMLWLSLYLASKFGIWIPTLPLTGLQGDAYGLQRNEKRQVVYRDEGAAPPTWLLYLIYIPIGVAIYVCGTRFFEYYHFGFDLLWGTIIGVLSAWFSFRWYNLPLGRSAGWAWGPRSRDRAFAIGIGRRGWVSDREAEVKPTRPEDIEMAPTAHPSENQTNGQSGRWQSSDQYHEIRSSAGDSVRPQQFAEVPLTAQHRM